MKEFIEDWEETDCPNWAWHDYPEQCTCRPTRSRVEEAEAARRPASTPSYPQYVITVYRAS
jgi:hypothetical protein